MSGQPGRMYADGLGVPPFAADPDVRCSPETADWFFLDSKIRYAKQLCRQCPVREDCVRWAVDTHVSDGVWGGLTVEERNQWAKGEGLIPAPTAVDVCGNGHPLTDDNVYYVPSRPTRWRCRQCGREQSARAAERKRLAAQQQHEVAA